MIGLLIIFMSVVSTLVLVGFLLGAVRNMFVRSLHNMKVDNADYFGILLLAGIIVITWAFWIALYQIVA